VRFLFALTALLGAFLLFLVEPMFARMVLPLLGGAPAVWNTCLVFYQVALLGGYLYAHAVRHRTARTQVLLHMALLAAAALLLPIEVRGGGSPPASANPIAWVFQLLFVSLGLPFVVLATTGPTIQRWYAAVSSKFGGDPYGLFAASNAGSFLALLGYPLLIEPTARLRVQAIGWTIGYAIFACLMIGCGIVMWRFAPSASPRTATDADRVTLKSSVDAEDEDIWSARVRWLGLAAIPSTLMMSVTTFISTDVAAVPLLWVVPLALYLLTFVLAFSDRPLVPRRLVAVLFPLAVVVVVALVLAPAIYPFFAIALHLSAFFVIALACHLELAASRPSSESLTEFYLWLSAGGAAGGIFNTLVAPLLFVNPFEYPLAALSACLLLPDVNSAAAQTIGHDKKRGRAASAATEAAAGTTTNFAIVVSLVPVLLVVASVWLVHVFDEQISHEALTRYLIIFGPACAVAFLMRRTPLRMGIALAIVAVAGSFIRFDNRVPIHVERSFFGVHRVMVTPGERVLLSGTTNHGVQSRNPALRCEPLSYYSKGGPVGQAMTMLTSRTPPATRFGVVGLGTASMAAYARPGQTWTFFEINPAVERLARDADYFTFLRDCAPAATVVVGDARLMLSRQPDASFDLLVLDAFSSDAIPVHLMTLEAMRQYFRTLAPGGVLAVHISNRFLDLAPVLAAMSRELGLDAILEMHVPSEEQYAISAEVALSRWVLIARSRADFGQLASDHRWESLDQLPGPVWTDDYSNVFSVVRY
jgi:SAM-dependent methyltransferase